MISCSLEAAVGGRAAEIDFGNLSIYRSPQRQQRQRPTMMMKVWPSSDCVNPPARFLKASSSSGSVGLTITGIKSCLSSSVRSISSRPGSIIVGGGIFGKSVSFSSMMMRHRAAVAAVTVAAVDEEGKELVLPEDRPQQQRESPCLVVPAGLLVAKGKEEISTSNDNNDEDYYDLLSVEGKKLVLKKKMKKKKTFWLPWQKEILSADDAICFGSSHGWLANIHRRNCCVYLYNPLINNSFPYIPLPPIETLPHVISSIRLEKHSKKFNTTAITTEYNIPGYSSAVPAEKVSENFFKKIALSSPPPHSQFGRLPSNSSDDCTVMTIQAIHGYAASPSGLAFCKIGDTSWTALEGTRYPYIDLVYFSEHQLFYALGSFGLEAWDLRNPVSPKCSLITESTIPGMTFMHCRLVVSSGDLLLVKRYFSTDYPFLSSAKWPLPKDAPTVFFEVYKFDFVRKEWVGKPDLGDQVLFVGANHSESLSANDFPPGLLIPNSIYFTTDRGISEGNDLGFFNLDDGIVRRWGRLKKKNNNKVQPTPSWIVPL